jgi:hypothetical protein
MDLEARPSASVEVVWAELEGMSALQWLLRKKASFV